MQKRPTESVGFFLLTDKYTQQKGAGLKFKPALIISRNHLPTLFLLQILLLVWTLVIWILRTGLRTLRT